ncbi:Blue copper protein [Morella rubra]|uniref:Blue copper protein n=1 Tax=Morella rubra TaxID=262757 RepID=A0A6A1W0U4_9ROSI|nr:Blue copper protein [Morella rubra]
MEKLMSVVVVFGVVAAVLLHCAAAQTVHVVGDSLGWTVPQGGAAVYQTWAANNKFMIGDILMFNFAVGEHDVLQVSKESFDSCSSANPIGNTITGGPANITLSNAGDHYYICTIGQHCKAGQKLMVTVSSSPGAAPPTSSPPPSTAQTPPATPSPTSGTSPDCTPNPSSSPAPSSDKAGGPTGQTPPETPPPPSSSSSGVIASFLVSLLSVAIGFLF